MTATIKIGQTFKTDSNEYTVLSISGKHARVRMAKPSHRWLSKKEGGPCNVGSQHIMTTPQRTERERPGDAGHTPGPWTLYEDCNQSEVLDRIVGPVVGASSALTATVARAAFGIRSNAEVAANARLIAAAPDLLAALKGFTDAMRRAERPDLLWLIEALHKADAAIARAEGRG